MKFVNTVFQSQCIFEFPDRESEFSRPRHTCGCGCAADRVDQVVVAQAAARRQPDAPVRGVDLGGGVDQQRNAGVQHVCIVDGRRAGVGHHLVQPDPLDELGPGIDQRDGYVAAGLQVVRCERAGVAAADHDDAGPWGDVGFGAHVGHAS